MQCIPCLCQAFASQDVQLCQIKSKPCLRIAFLVRRKESIATLHRTDSKVREGVLGITFYAHCGLETELVCAAVGDL
jgi:hypothetical protein